MKIQHLALLSRDIEKLKDFYIKYFDAKSNDKYANEKTKFQSYFLSFDGGTRLEIMQMSNLEIKQDREQLFVGFAHWAISVGSKDAVDALTNRLGQDGYNILSEPRTTGDGYYESVVADPDGNKIEITI